MFSVLISIVVLGIAGWLLIALLYKDPISRQKRAIEEMQDYVRKSELIKKDQTANNFAIARYERVECGIKNAFDGKDPEIDYDRHQKARLIWRLVIVGIILDWLVQWMVNQRIQILSPLLWAIPSLLLALLISWFTELAAFALTSDSSRQARAERICRDAMIVTGILSVTGMLLFFYGRTVSAASVNEWLIMLISGSLWIVAEGLGVSCGFAAAWARHIDRDGMAFNELQKIEQKLQSLYEFKDWLNDQQVKSKGKVSSIALLLFIIAIVPASILAPSASGQDLSILIDGTASVDQTRMSDALTRLRESAPILARKFSLIKIGIFSNEGPFTKISTVSIPPMVSGRDCSRLAVNNKSFRQDLTIMFPGIQEYKDGRNTKLCLTSNLSVEQKNRDNFSDTVCKIRALIPESIQPKIDCTGIAGLLQFVFSSHSKSGSTFMLITDGEETCSQNSISGIQIPAGAKVILFLIPKMGPIEKEGPEALKRGDVWQSSIPGLIVRPYTDITETFARQ